MSTNTPLAVTAAEALKEYRASKAYFDNGVPRTQEEDDAAFKRMLNAQKDIMTAPATSPEDIALKLEFALAEELCGGEFVGELSGLDDAMFRGMIDTLRTMRVEG